MHRLVRPRRLHRGAVERELVEGGIEGRCRQVWVQLRQLWSQAMVEHDLRLVIPSKPAVSDVLGAELFRIAVDHLVAKLVEPSEGRSLDQARL